MVAVVHINRNPVELSDPRQMLSSRALFSPVSRSRLSPNLRYQPRPKAVGCIPKFDAAMSRDDAST